MNWLDNILRKIEGSDQELIINDSKTPSGRVHVGSLRGVLIHDAIAKSIKSKNIPVRFRFGIDDCDPLDELPAEHSDFFRPYLGAPLYSIPAPPESKANSLSEHYMAEFLQVFDELEVDRELYRMHEIYRSGQFNEVIDIILKNAATVRNIYKTLSKANKRSDWYPFQAICERCGRIGSSRTTDYDAKEVSYFCDPNLVTWAQGCGYQGRISPFDGNGKLPWKLEWVAKWIHFKVSIEGAGKDHSTKGGSRDIAERCLQEIFGTRAPVNIPYEFFLVDGAKMSSSRGIGASAREISRLLPAEILRFLLLRTPPNRPVNFTPDEATISRLFNDFDRLHTRFFHDANLPESDKRVYQLCKINAKVELYLANFALLLTLVQLPHVNIQEEIEHRKGGALSAVERKQLQLRLSSVRYWLAHYADETDRIRLQEKLPEGANQLSESQRAFLHALAIRLETLEWHDTAIQSAIFSASRLTPLRQALAFKALYSVFLDKDSGPKAGNLLAALERGFVLKRLQELPYDRDVFWQESAILPDTLEQFLHKRRGELQEIVVTLKSIADGGKTMTEWQISLKDGKQFMQRVYCEQANNSLESYIKHIEEQYSLSIIVNKE